MMICFCFITAVIASLSLLCFITLRKRKALLNDGLFGKHVLVTGGSSGIGKACAVLAARMGANVTIMARDQKKLDAATREIQVAGQDHTNLKVLALSVDVSNDYNALEKSLEKASNELGPIYMLINCAGSSISHRFEDTNMEDFDRMLKLNFLGSVAVTKAVLPSMKERGSGHVVFVSSLAGLIGLYGYTAYSASKFALVGLAEALSMEVKPYNVKVTVSFPPDTDTPGFEEEEKTKPVETRKISESGGLVSPEVVAKQLVSDALLGRFSSVVGFEGLMLETACSGMAPVSSYLQLLFQVCTMGVFRLAGAVFLWNCDRTVEKCAKLKEQQKKAE